jgi:hypothetical protein
MKVALEEWMASVEKNLGSGDYEGGLENGATAPSQKEPRKKKRDAKR